MSFRKTWKPSKSAIVEFAKKMEEVNNFCLENNIQTSYNNDSYYFRINNINYRVSNHTVERSNAGAYDACGCKVRELYHPAGREADIIYIYASKTRIIDIYNDLVAGFKLDGRGNRI